MPDDLKFTIPIPRRPQGKEYTAAEAEKIMLAELRRSELQFEKALMDLAYFYSRVNQQEIAMHYVQRLLNLTEDLEKKANYFLKMGQLMEQMHNYEAAIQYYQLAFSLEPIENETYYYINNNLGYCLNHFGRHQEAESCCLAAIKINPRRYNAYKNLGISLEGQDRFVEAAVNYVKAIQANAADPRALAHLLELFAKHPEIERHIPDIRSQIEQCRSAVNLARRLHK